MSVERKCPECGTELEDGSSEGLCLKCLLQVGANLHLDESQIFPSEIDAVQAEPAAATGSSKSTSPPATSPTLAQPTFSHFGDYELQEEIARGGMGIVYRARQISLDRIVAVKMLLAGPLAGKDFVQRFRTEAAAAASLQHPNIVAIHEVGFAKGQHFFAMDFVEGLTLAQLVAKGALPPRRAATYLKTIADAIHFAHERNVLHRDLKPSNILIDSANDQPRVTDFGLAKRLESETDLTLSGQVLGSPNFMPPEQATAKRGAVGKHSDVYSLGAILYYSLTGRPPFQGETLTDVLVQVTNNEPLAPRLLTPGLPHDLETICLKCLEKEPSARYQTAHELADELSRFLNHEPIHARPISQAEHAVRWCRRKPALASSLSLILILILILIIGAPIAILRINAERRRAEQNLYDSDMSLAQREWDEGNIGRTRELLQAHVPRSGEPDQRGFEWYYFSKLCWREQRMTFSNHNGPVTCLALAADGRRLATGGFGSPVQIWDTVTGARTQLIAETNVLSLGLSADNRLLGVGGIDEFSVWNLETGQAIFRHTEAVGKFQVAFPRFENQLVVGKRGGLRKFGSDGGSTEIWDLATKERTRAFPDSGGYVALGNGGKWLATGNAEQKIRIWDLSNGQLVQTLGSGAVSAMALSPDGQTLAASQRGEVSFWDVPTGLSTGQLGNSPAEGWALAYSPDGRYLAMGGPDQTINLWNATTRQKVQLMRGHGSQVESLVFSPDGQTLASGSKDKTARLWKVETTPTVTTTVSNLTGRHVFSPDSRWIAAGLEPAGVAIWGSRTLELRALCADAVSAVGFSPDSRQMIARGNGYFLRIFDADSGAVIKTVPGKSVALHGSNTALSPDGTVLAVGFENGTLGLYEADTGVEIAIDREAFASAIVHVEFSPDGKLLAAAGWEEQAGRLPSAKVFSVRTHEKIRVLTGHADTVLGAGFSSDGQTLITGGADNAMRFWDTSTWNEKFSPVTQKETVLSLATSRDGKTFASLTVDSKLTLWSVATRRELVSLKGPHSAQYISFSPDGQILAAYSWEGVLRLWWAPITK